MSESILPETAAACACALGATNVLLSLADQAGDDEMADAVRAMHLVLYRRLGLDPAVTDLAVRRIVAEVSGEGAP